jgi:hypothetical protein
MYTATGGSFNTAQMQDSFRTMAAGLATTLGVASANSTLELMVLEVDNRRAGLCS